MEWDVLVTAAPYLAVLMYVLVMGFLTILAARRHHQITIHDTIRSARIRRREYLAELRTHLDAD